MTQYLEISHVMAIHQVLIEKYGGLHGLRDRGLLDSALSQPRQSAFGEDIYPDTPSKAAAYAYSISENQPFLDGNKRTATAVALTFLRLNQFDFKANEHQVYETIMKLANKQISKDTLIEWFRKKSVRKKRKARKG